MLLTLAGCATPGANHVYVTTQATTGIQDVTEPAASLPQGIAIGERVLGLAYDYNTDHLFLRVWPQQVIRVIERPSGKILRQMRLPPELHTATAADLAVRSRDRHLFAVHPDGHSVVELTLFGEKITRLELPRAQHPITGLAFDQKADRLLTLTGQIVGAYTTDGQLVQAVTLQAPIRSVSLGYDSAAGHFFAPLADGRTLGEFDASGALVQRHPLAGPSEITAIDAGPRSLVRVF